MTKFATQFSMLGAAALVASALASPAMAQEVVYNPGKCSQYYPNANCQNLGPGNPYQRRAAYRQSGNWNNSYNRLDIDRRSDRRDRFGPGEVAAGVVGGAIGTAGAIAAAPFAAFDGGYRGGYYRQSYAQRNGFVCTPGTWFKADDGRRHMCQ
jgi:hypothetical protein